MDLDKVKNILNTLKTDTNENLINALLEKIESLPENEFLGLINQLGNEENIKNFLTQKINEMSKPKTKPQPQIYYYSNVAKDNRESRTCTQVLDAAKKILTLLKKENLTIYISGGVVPYLLLNEDSNRLHDDVDTVCKLSDIEKIRELIQKEKLYKPDWDSKNFNKTGKDYGFEFIVDGVPFGIYPFEYKNGIITQYSFDPYTKECKTKTIPIQALTDYVYTYNGVDGNTYNTMSLEYIKLSKDHAKRPKDIVDSEKIQEIGIRPDVMARLTMYKKEREDR